MLVKSLQIYQFRNVSEINLSFSPELNFIVGRNGQGKTNLLEAIHLIGTGKSFRTKNFQDLIQWGKTEASVNCSISRQISKDDLRVIIKEKGREYWESGKKLSGLNDFIGKLVAVTFSPSDLELIKGGPLLRRSFLDRHIVDLKPHTLAVYLNYSRALRNKNILLKGQGYSLKEVEPWNQILAENGAKIVGLRIDLIEKLYEKINQIHTFFGESDGEISLSLKSDLIKSKQQLDVEELLALLNSDFNKEKIFGHALHGPHRDDLILLLNNRDSRAFASQGQIRSLVLSLKLTVITLLEEVLGESPVILLDDVDSELDLKRSDLFFELLLKQKRQVFITGTNFNEERINISPKSQVFNVQAGQIEKNASF